MSACVEYWRAEARPKPRPSLLLGLDSLAAPYNVSTLASLAQRIASAYSLKGPGFNSSQKHAWCVGREGGSRWVIHSHH